MSIKVEVVIIGVGIVVSSCSRIEKSAETFVLPYSDEEILEPSSVLKVESEAKYRSFKTNKDV